MLTERRATFIRKAMETVVRYGDTFGAKRLVPIDHNLHMVTRWDPAYDR